MLQLQQNDKDHKNFEIMVKLTKRLKPNSTSNGIITQLKGTLPSVSLCQQLLPLCLLLKSYHILLQPVTMHYRNKNDFHIRYDLSGRVVVGLCVGKASTNTLRCIKADNLVNTHPTHTNVAR